MQRTMNRRAKSMKSVASERIKTVSSRSPATTIVFDAGVRYGMHPRWREFRGEMMYYGFDPDVNEVTRLKRVNALPNISFIPMALAAQSGAKTLRLYKHRGYSSFFELDPQYGRVAHYRPGEGALEQTVEVEATTVDEFAKRERVEVDFMKVDVEGAELDVLRGAIEQLGRSVKGVRISVWFTEGFKGGALFPDVHRFLLEHGFFLVNLDYAGRGYPVHPCVGNPDRLQPDHDRYGVLSACEAVYLKQGNMLDQTCRTSTDARGLAHLKYAYFCFLNDAPDVALNSLLDFARRPSEYSDSVKATKLYQQVRLTTLRYLGRWRTNPTDHNWKLAQDTAQELFGLQLEAGHKYWELAQELECATRDGSPCS